MIEHPIIKRLLTELQKEYAEDEGYFFDDKLEECEGVYDEFALYLEHFYSGHYITSYGFEILAHFTFSRTIESILNLKSKNKFIEEASMTAIYSYLTLYIACQTCKCTLGQSNIDMQRAIIHFSLNILLSQEEQVEELGSLLIDGLNGENCTIQRGNYEAYGAWFIIELYSYYSGKEINKRRALYPKEGSNAPYNMILDDWDTEDMEQIDLFITLLSTKYLESATIPMTEDNEDEKRANLEIPHIQLFPYEILAWLKLREKAGLKNPTEYTHPLMNTPIAKMFLDIKEPLPKPKELPYAKELLEKLKEKCPDVEIPEWLGGEKTEKESEHIPSILLKSNQTAQKTGRYQATLPNEHPRAEFLKSSGFDVKIVKEGQSVGTFGFSGSDEDAIVWVYLGE